MTYYKLKFGTFGAIMLLTVAWVKLHIPFWIIFYLCVIIGIGISTIHLLYPQTKYNVPVNVSAPDTTQESLRRAYLNSLSGSEFEHEIVNLLRRDGFIAERTKPGTPGIDIRAQRVDHETGQVLENYAIECKRYSDNVGLDKIVYFETCCMKEPPGTKKVFFTTSQFSQPALEYARTHGIDLVDGEVLKKYL